MTCPTMLLRRPAVAGSVAGLRGQGARLVDALRTKDDAVVQLVRFVLVGGVANVLYAMVFLGVAPLGDQPANLAGALASSALANELHRRLTFHAGGRVGWPAAQWAGGGTALAGWAASSAALGVLAASGSTAGAPARVAVVVSVTAAVGLARFVALRWLFRPRAAGVPA